MLKFFAEFPTSDHEVLGSNPAGGGIQLMIQLMILQSFPFNSLSSFRNDLNNVERGVKHQTECRTKSLPDIIPSAHFCIGGHNPSHVFLQRGYTM